MPKPHESPVTAYGVNNDPVSPTHGLRHTHTSHVELPIMVLASPISCVDAEKKAVSSTALLL